MRKRMEMFNLSAPWWNIVVRTLILRVDDSASIMPIDVK